MPLYVKGVNEVRKEAGLKQWVLTDGLTQEQISAIDINKYEAVNTVIRLTNKEDNPVVVLLTQMIRLFLLKL